MSWTNSRTVALTGVFLASGCAALIYEIVWLQQLGLVLGATSVTLGILLTSFMGGMGLGSWCYPVLSRRTRSRLTDYALLELAIAVCGGLSLLILPRLADFYAVWGSPGTSDVPFRAITALCALCPPTMLMGATLPAVSRGIAATPTGAARLGLFYGANTLGAVCGSLGAGLYLLRVYDVTVATGVAMGLNVVCALAALMLNRGAEALPIQAVPEQAEQQPEPSTWSTPAARWVMLVVACSGMTALGAEVVWTRLLALLLGPTTYTFSILLAVFLGGLGLGSTVTAGLSRRTQAPALWLGITQLLLVVAIPYAAAMIVSVLPGWFSERLIDLTIWDRLGGDVLRAVIALLPATCLWGATFPLAIATAAAGSTDRDAARLVGRLYAANTFGAILGTLGFSLVIHPWLGSHFAQQLLTAAAGLCGVLVIRQTFAASSSAGTVPRRLSATWVTAAGLAAVAGIVWLLPATPAALIAHGNQVRSWNTDRATLFVREGLDSAVAVMESSSGNRCFHVAGRIEATNSGSDMRTQRLLGHLPAAAHPYPRTVLVVGCGSGMTAGSFLLHPSVERIVICEIEPAVVESNRVHFAEYNQGVLDHPKTQIVYDDARHFLATTKESFDVITTDPIHPWVRGSAALYTREFYELCRRRLNDDGIVTQWVPLYESNHAAVQCELATLLDLFPESLLFSGQSRRTGYDLVVVGRKAGEAPSVTRMIDRLMRSPVPLRQSLGEVGLGDPRRLEETFVATGHDLKQWLSTAERNLDRNLRLQYLAGITPDAHTEETILIEMAIARETAREAAQSSRALAH